MTKKTAVVICPGRGSYLKENLGTLTNRSSEVAGLVDTVDGLRHEQGYPTITELDSAEKYSVGTHTKGEHASPLIQTCSMADFLEIDREEFDILAVTGNSMGWYTALGCAEALDIPSTFDVVQTMGGMMRNGLIGGQVIYPIVDSNWQKDESIEKHIASLLEEASSQSELEIYVSIRLGGFVVFGANEPGVRWLLKKLEPREDGRYPMKLVNHGAFHTPLLRSVSDEGFSTLSEDLFNQPELPLVDGRGSIWQPYSTDPEELRDYTLGHQVVETYDFGLALEIALKEFAPSHLILLGPGTGLGGAIGQLLCSIQWQGLKSKKDFKERQKSDPILVTTGK